MEKDKSAGRQNSIAEWMLKFPAGIWNGQTIALLFNSWKSDNQLPRLNEWVDGLDPALRDNLLTAYCAENSYSDDRPTDLALAMRISDSRMRDEAVQTVVSDWIRYDREDALAWIQNSQLPSAQKSRLLELAPKK